MKKIIDYKIILNNENMESLEKQVNSLIKEDWQPLGPPFECGKEHSYLAQAMVQYAE